MLHFGDTYSKFHYDRYKNSYNFGLPLECCLQSYCTVFFDASFKCDSLLKKVNNKWITFIRE